ncbi:hypothetical protein Q2B95_08120 [Stenotrophomonas maltophilia]|uniref:hypothetical protein n=1 Tax=Stenotrophomonas maltophilia TaxID=40324 RepID=UPI0030B2FA43
MTFAIALLGAVLGVINTVIAYRRGAVRWKVVPRLKMGKHGALELFIDLINTGRVPVSIEKVTLAGGVKLQTRSGVLTDANGHPRFPLLLDPGKKRTIGPVHGAALNEVAVLQPITIVAETEDGRSIKVRCAGLREVYMQFQTAKIEPAA